MILMIILHQPSDPSWHAVPSGALGNWTLTAASYTTGKGLTVNAFPILLLF